jgi:deoxyribonuclease V
MEVPQAWLYPSSMEEAKQAQQIMAEKVILEDRFETLQWIGGMDVSHKLYDPTKIIHAAAVILNAHDLKVVDHAAISEKQTFPYIPGFLGFREAPALVHSFQKLNTKPNILLIDGHGVSHPRGLGIASHIGILLDIPTIGVAKSILVGKPAYILDDTPGSHTPLIWKDQIIGMLFRSKKYSHPLIISAGHKISLETAVEIVKKTLRGYRLPEPTRHAHLTANAYRKNFSYGNE